jgi:hypothetical protein
MKRVLPNPTVNRTPIGGASSGLRSVGAGYLDRWASFRARA